MAKRATKEEKRIDDEISLAFKQHFDRTPISMLEIPRIYRIARERMSKGQTANEAVGSVRMLYVKMESIFTMVGTGL